MYRTDAHEDRSLFLMGHDKTLFAFRRHNGELAWKFENQYAYHYYVDFVVVGSLVFVPVGAYIVRLDYATGRPINSIPLASDVLRIVHDEGLLFAFGGQGIFCLDLEGRVLWSRPHTLPTATTMPTYGFPGNIVHGFRDSG
jgi:outer membrane protein assembly factor BamB